MNPPPTIDADIHKASTLPASFYQSEEVFENSKEKVFARSWQFIGDTSVLGPTINSYPINVLEGFLNEPLMITKDDNEKLHLLSNVCTHRGNVVLTQPSNTKKLICGYHGRRFSLEGTFEHMPEFEGVEGFPDECDHLTRVESGRWHQFLFANLAADLSPDDQGFAQWINPLEERVGFLPIDDFKYRADLSKTYLVNSNWALYCDNYLEGFHIPFVHHGLNQVIDYGSYETLLFDRMNVQVGYESGGTEIFDLPKSHIDFGKRVAAYYFWLFPNAMFNFYPWGLSLNLVLPLSINQCKVQFLTYMYDESKVDQSAGAAIDKVEREDEAVVEQVQTGVRSRYYKAGRYSPTREKGVHQFHRILAQALAKA